MTSSPATRRLNHSGKRAAFDLRGLRDMILRIAERRLDDPDTIDDVVQETFVRILEIDGRLEQRSRLSYAAIIARNLIISLERRREIERRHAPRLFERQEPARPDEQVLGDEDKRAVMEALARLSARDRSLVVGHDVHGASTAELGRAYDMSAGSVAVRLTRLRAQMRLDYVLTLRQSKLPTPLCRPVLLALSTGDKRRQRSLGAADHLLDCATCASLSEPVVSRRRSLAPLFFGGEALEVAFSRLREHAGQMTAAGVTIAAVVAGLWLMNPADKPRSPNEAVLSIGGQPAFSEGGLKLARYEGKQARASGVQVLSVPSDEGFWVGPSDDNRIWVSLIGSGESSIRVRSGQSLQFEGKLVRNPPGLISRIGLEPREGAAELRRQGYHISVKQARLEPR